MKKFIIAVKYILIIFIYLFTLQGCNQSNSGASSSGNTASYGELSFSGSGTVVTGNSFKPLSKLSISSSAYSWYNINLSGGTIQYPYLVFIVTLNGSGVITSIQVSRMLNESTASDQWVLISTPSTSEAAVSTESVVFSNLTIPGYVAASTTTSLVLNGALNF